MRIYCPHCRDRAITRTSKRPVPVFYEVYAQCANPHCGWAGKLQVEFVTTTSPSRQPHAAANTDIRRLLVLERAAH